MYEKINNFLKENKKEIKKVNWPNRKQTFHFTLMVVGFCLVLAFYLGFLDAVFFYFLNRFFI